MSYIAIVRGRADGTTTPHDGRYVKAWNSDVAFGTLSLDSTADRAQAKRWGSLAVLYYQQRKVSLVQPFRPDGGLNRPLTGINLEIIDEEKI